MRLHNSDRRPGLADSLLRNACRGSFWHTANVTRSSPTTSLLRRPAETVPLSHWGDRRAGLTACWNRRADGRPIELPNRDSADETPGISG
jgi:hypothetical protein